MNRILCLLGMVYVSVSLGATEMEPAEGFTISGDLSSIDGDLTGAYVEVTGWEYDATGEQLTLDFGRATLEQGKFEIEAKVDEPKVVNVVVIAPRAREHTQFLVVIEPGAKITLSSKGTWLKGVFPISGKGRHAQLVESWQQSEEYLTIREEYLTKYRDYVEQSQIIQNIPENSKNNPDSRIDSTDTESQEEIPQHRELVKKLNRIRYGFLEKVATNAKNPIDALLALELRAFWGDEEALPIYDRLAKTLDEDLVTRRVIHNRNVHASHLASIGFDRSLVIGKGVPDFTLPSMHGEEITLRDVLDQKDLVLVDFWASWCGPCIATFPALKELYASYSLHGFEIVSVSVDSSHDIWSQGSEQHELPWVNLGELKGFQGEIARSYGVTFIPKSYLINPQGHIVQKDLSINQLKEFLVQKYGEPPKTDDPSTGTN